MYLLEAGSCWQVLLLLPITAVDDLQGGLPGHLQRSGNTGHKAIHSNLLSLLLLLSLNKSSCYISQNANAAKVLTLLFSKKTEGVFLSIIFFNKPKYIADLSFSE